MYSITVLVVSLSGFFWHSLFSVCAYNFFSMGELSSVFELPTGMRLSLKFVYG